MNRRIPLLVRSLTTGILVSCLSACAFMYEQGQFVVDHSEGEQEWVSVDPKWRLGYATPTDQHLPEASGWQRSATTHERGRLDRAKVLFEDPSIVVLVSIQSDGGTKPISAGPLLPIIPLFFLSESGPSELKIDVELHAPMNEGNGWVEIDLAQTKVRLEDREVPLAIQERTRRSSPAMTGMVPLPDCLPEDSDCWTTILPGDFETVQLFVREFNKSLEFALDLPPMRLEEGRIVEPPSIRFAQSMSVVFSINTADPY